MLCPCDYRYVLPQLFQTMESSLSNNKRYTEVKLNKHHRNH